MGFDAKNRHDLNRMNSTAQRVQLGKELQQKLNVVKATYDFSVHGGAVGTINLDGVDGSDVIIPNGAIIVHGLIDIITAMTSTGDNGTIALNSNSAGDLKAAVDADTLSGLVATIPVGSAATSIKMTADRTLTVTIATNAILSGKFDLYVQYYYAPTT